MSGESSPPGADTPRETRLGRIQAEVHEIEQRLRALERRLLRSALIAVGIVGLLEILLAVYVTLGTSR